ncbi:hypothetical protein H072_8043 [Dactylellina haptotyla CBS 200.50]|uniref:PHD finger-like domain-containing protein 5A n=8 Tax=Orbiliaceae TaxID=47021 RepID=S8AAR6_DACHA|nr:hypothetical protein H072_8043 [Dactylellina haptotyla CBS 200.50]
MAAAAIRNPSKNFATHFWPNSPIRTTYRHPTNRQAHRQLLPLDLASHFDLITGIDGNNAFEFICYHFTPRSHVPYIATMSRHHPDLVMCRKQPGIAIGRLCDKCDGKCPVCDSYVRPTTLVRICDECSFGNYQNKCIVCGGEGISDAFYCFECTRLEKDRDGCPKIINLGSSRTDLFYQKKNFRNH